MPRPRSCRPAAIRSRGTIPTSAAVRSRGGLNADCQGACKPNSVFRRALLGGPFGPPKPPAGIAIIPLGPRLPSGSSSRPGDSPPEAEWDGRPLSPYLALLRMGFTVPPPLPSGRCALTAPFHPCRPFGRRSLLCGTFLRVAATGHYPACRPYGVRTFLPDLSGRSPGPLGAKAILSVKQLNRVDS